MYKTGKSRGWSYFTIKALHALRNKVQLFFSPLQPLSIFSDIQGGRRKNLEEGTFSAFLSFYSERAGHSFLIAPRLFLECYIFPDCMQLYQEGVDVDKQKQQISAILRKGFLCQVNVLFKDRDIKRTLAL